MTSENEDRQETTSLEQSGSGDRQTVELVLLQKADSTSNEGVWDKVEKPAKVLSLIAIPVVLAILGWITQDRLTSRNLNRDYVRLAVSILTEKDSSKVAPGLRSWAVDLLNTNSPVSLPQDVIEELKGGNISLPQAFTITPEVFNSSIGPGIPHEAANTFGTPQMHRERKR